MMNVLEPRYDMSLRVNFSGKIVPSMYEQEKSKVMAELPQASLTGITKRFADYIYLRKMNRMFWSL